MKILNAFSATLLGLAAIGTGAIVVSAVDLPDPQPIRFVEARELDFEGELKDAIYNVGYEGDYELSTVDLALELGKSLSEIGDPGRNAQVAAALCAIYESEVETRRQNFSDYYNALTNIATLGQDAGGEHAEAISAAITATYEEDPAAFEVYVLGVAAATQECQS